MSRYKNGAAAFIHLGTHSCHPCINLLLRQRSSIGLLLLCPPTQCEQHLTARVFEPLEVSGIHLRMPTEAAKVHIHRRRVEKHHKAPCQLFGQAVLSRVIHIEVVLKAQHLIRATSSRRNHAWLPHGVSLLWTKNGVLRNKSH